MRILLLFITATLLIYKSFAKEELYSAVEELATLSQNNDVVTRELKNLIKEIEKGVELTRKQVHKIEAENALMMTDVKKYIGNPLNSLLLIKQLSYDLEAMKSMFLSKLENFMKKVQNVKLPLSEFDGAVDGLFRLQQTYKLKSDDLARGNIEGKKYRNDLDVNDLMAIGKVMMKFDKNYGIEYLKLARQKNEASKEVTNIFLLEEIFQTYKSNEKHMEAVEILDELLKINPNNEEMQAERLQLEMLALFQENKDKADKDKKDYQKTVEFTSSYWTSEKEAHIISRACRGLVLKSAKDLSKLHCRMLSRSPFTKIAPLKIEEANLDPIILIFHDILSENEMEIFKALASSNLQRAEIITVKSTHAITRERVAKLEFFDDWKHGRLPALSRRVADMSGLSMISAESWQIQNYGIGGHYQPHHDYTDEGQEFTLGTGNRIATALFYLSDVEKGGATIFPLLRVYVPPKKGTAVFWYNLSSSGDREVMTRHSGCPVLVGSKIVANKWLHEYGQEWKRPCELQPKHTDEKYYLKYYNLKDYGINVLIK